MSFGLIETFLAGVIVGLAIAWVIVDRVVAKVCREKIREYLAGDDPWPSA